MKTHILFVLDKSGSMSGRKEATISGFNEYLRDLQKDENLEKAKMSLTLFDTTFTDMYVDEKLENVSQLVADSYVPSGMTALYDAVAHVLSITKDTVKKKHRALVIIMTDGAENSSKEHTRAQIFEMIKSFEDAGNYTFVFLGCDQDVWAEGAKLGAVQGNIKAYDKDDIQEAFRGLSTSVSNYAGGSSLRSTAFWEKPPQ